MHQKSLIYVTPRADGDLATGDSRRERPLQIVVIQVERLPVLQFSL